MTELPTKEEIIRKIQKAKPELKRLFGVESVILFGSYARNEATSESDIDLLVKMPPSYKNFFRLQSYLESLLGKKVDLGTKLRLYVQRQAEKEMIHI